MKTWFSVVLVLLTALPALADIEIQSQYAQGEKILAKVTPAGAAPAIPEKAILRCRLTVSGKAEVWQPASGGEYAIWAADGEHTVRAVGMWFLTDTGELGGKLLECDFFEFTKTITVGSAPPPPPQPDVNPYRPAPAFQAAAQPVKSLRLEKTDSRALAALYSSVASQIKAGAFQNLGAVRADLLKRGSELQLKGKYAGLAAAVEKYLGATVGLEQTAPAERAADSFETLAWAVFEAGGR